METDRFYEVEEIDNNEDERVIQFFQAKSIVDIYEFFINTYDEKKVFLIREIREDEAKKAPRFELVVWCKNLYFPVRHLGTIRVKK
ncbi:MAG: hypothetical protein QW727_02035 [Candidatus Pacearchaeota archaeon]